MINDPTLFIDSVSDKKQGNENQDFFDSRINHNRKKLILHRLEDIKAMTFFKMNMYVIIDFKHERIEGIVENIDDEAIYIRTKGMLKEILIKDINDIIIKKI